MRTHRWPYGPCFHFLQFLNIFTVSHESHIFFMIAQTVFIQIGGGVSVFSNLYGEKNEITECIHFRSTEIRKKCENKIFIILK